MEGTDAPKVTGYQLRESLKVWELKKNAILDALNESFMAFEDEKSEKDPIKATQDLEDCERSIAQLQVAQSYYNLQVNVTIDKEIITLCEAVKRVGGAGRIEKIWRTSTKGIKRDRMSRYDLVRNKEEEIMKPTIKPQDAIKIAQSKARLAGQLRNAIATGNSEAVVIPDLDPELLQ